jgi:hypothetical protein
LPDFPYQESLWAAVETPEIIFFVADVLSTATNTSESTQSMARLPSQADAIVALSRKGLNGFCAETQGDDELRRFAQPVPTRRALQSERCEATLAIISASLTQQGLLLVWGSLEEARLSNLVDGAAIVPRTHG